MVTISTSSPVFASSTKSLPFDKLEGVILKISKGKDFVEEAKIGDEVEIVTNQTPFYAESGGQVGDRGVIYSNDCKVVIEDTQKKMGDLYVHFGKVNKGFLKIYY